VDNNIKCGMLISEIFSFLSMFQNILRNPVGLRSQYFSSWHHSSFPDVFYKMSTNYAKPRILSSSKPGSYL